MNISTEVQVKLKKIAKRNKMEYAAVVKLYEGAYDKKAKEVFIIRKVQNEIRKENQRKNPFLKRKGGAQPVYGFIVGDMGMRDKAAEMRRNVKRYIEKNGVQAAIEAQKINGDNEILDQRKLIFGKENPNYLEVLDPKLKVRSRVMFGFFRSNGEKTFKWASMQTSDNKLAKAWDKVKFYTPCQSFFNIRENLPSMMRMNSSGAEGTVSIFKAIKEDWDINAIMEETLKKQYTKVSHAEKHFRATIENCQGDEDADLAFKLEMVARAYDPCISCSVHLVEK